MPSEDGLQKTGVCYKCGQRGHVIRNCPKGPTASKVLPTREEGFDRALMTKEELGKSKGKVNFEGEGLQVGV